MRSRPGMRSSPGSLLIGLRNCAAVAALETTTRTRTRSRRIRHSSRNGALALVERQQRLRVLRTDVVGARTNQAVVRVLLETMRRPARDAADRKNRCEEIDVDAKRVVRGR